MRDSSIPTTLTLRDGPTVRRLGFGAMRITGRGVWGPPDEDEAITLLRRVVDQGVNFIDTADSYGPDISESLIAKALFPYPSDLVIASKGGFIRPGPGRWAADGRPEHLRQACEGSLKRLRLDRIDLYQLHTVDRQIPIEDSIGALVELQQEGKINHIGVSNISVNELHRAQKMAKIVSVQNCYNFYETWSDDILDVCTDAGIAFIAFYPLAKGRLTAANSPLFTIAERHHATAGQIALAWLLHRSPIILPIPGTSSIAHFDENLAASGIHLGAAELRALAVR
jgi:pyridoxine 4-dehydrogenase